MRFRKTEFEGAVSVNKEKRRLKIRFPKGSGKKSWRTPGKKGAAKRGPLPNWWGVERRKTERKSTAFFLIRKIKASHKNKPKTEVRRRKSKQSQKVAGRGKRGLKKVTLR